MSDISYISYKDKQKEIKMLFKLPNRQSFAESLDAADLANYRFGDEELTDTFEWSSEEAFENLGKYVYSIDEITMPFFEGYFIALQTHHLFPLSNDFHYRDLYYREIICVIATKDHKYPHEEAIAKFLVVS